MKDYDNIKFSNIAEQIKNIEQTTIDIKLIDTDIVYFQYFLTRKFYYASIIDDYACEIIDRNSLFEALYYQIKLITMHNLNWDALHEGLADALKTFLEFEGICLLFRHGNILKDRLPGEFKMLAKIIKDINKQNISKKITMLLC